MTFTLTCNENLLQLDEIITVRLLWIVSYIEMNVSRLDNDYDFDIPFNPDAKLIIKSKINRNRDNANWIPSSHYDYSLKEVQNQLTPAQLYKENYREFGKAANVIKNLDRRILASFDVCLLSALRLQARFRGGKGRQVFNEIKHHLGDRNIQRDIKRSAITHFEKGDKKEALDMINKYTGNQMNINLYIMKCKLYYSLHEIKNCESAAKEIIDLDESNIDGHYLLACCYTSKQQYESAFKQLSILFSVNGSAQIENVIRLNGFLCTKINPPQYDEAVLSFDLLVSKYPEDMNALLQRACCLVCLQEWDRAIDDYSLIIDFQPNLIHVICMRARTYACQRKWSYAQKDYEYVLRSYPDDEMALKGLQDLNHLYETLPMSIPDRDI